VDLLHNGYGFTRSGLRALRAELNANPRIFPQSNDMFISDEPTSMQGVKHTGLVGICLAVNRVTVIA